MNNVQLRLIYVWDAYCGWCYGFSQHLRAFHEAHPELPVSVLSGGLFTGDRRLSMSAFPHIPEANARISELTGAEFGSAYQELLTDDTFLMDSSAAAAGFIALRSCAPERAVYLASAMQHAFYHDGKSLSAPATYREIAAAFDIDPDAVQLRMEDADTVKEVQEEFNVTRQLGVESYPTLLLQRDQRYFRLGAGSMDLSQLESRLLEAMSR